MRRIFIALFVISIVTEITFAQPDIDWFKTYHRDNHDYIYDIYQASDGGYVICGKSQPNHRAWDAECQMWVVRTHNNGDLIWSCAYGDPDDFDRGESIIEVDEDGFLIGGVSGAYSENHQIAAWRIDEDGEEIWFETYGRGMCHAVIELKSGEYLLTGGTHNHGSGFLVCINEDGDLLWESYYDSGIFYGMRETEGGVVLAGLTNNLEVWVVKASIEEEGEVIWDHDYFPYTENWIRSIVSAQGGGFILAGRSLEIIDDNRIGSFMTFKIDDDGNQDWVCNYNLSDQTDSEYGYCIAKYPEHGYILVGDLSFYSRGGVIRITSAGVSRWGRTYNFFRNPDDEIVFTLNSLSSVIIDNDGYAIAAGYGESQENWTDDGFILKLEPEILEPRFMIYSPEDTVLTVLQNDSVKFAVSAIGYNDAELFYTWTLDDTVEISNDTLTIVAFEELGEHFVRCEVTDNEFTTGITWHVSVEEVIIRDFTPDTLEFTVLRGDSADFRLVVGAVEDIELDYLWLHMDNEDQYEVSSSDTARVIFDMSGEHRVVGTVSWADRSLFTTWLINAVGFRINGYEPDTLNLSLMRNSNLDFSLDVSQVDDVDVEYQWTMSGRDAQWGLGTESSATAHFDQTGDFQVECYIFHEGQADAVTWNILVSSCIWSWYPLETEIRVPVDTTMFFHLETYNPHSDSLCYAWVIGGNVIDVDSTTAELFIDFPEVCNCEVLGIVSDGSEVDTIRWEIEVFDPTGVNFRLGLVPESVSLSPPIPNPFNAVARIEFGLPFDSDVSLKVFDLQGRMVSEPAKGIFTSGYHSASFNASNLPAGVYIVKFTTERLTITQKAVLIR